MAGTTTGTFYFYKAWGLNQATAQNVSSDTFKCILLSSSYTPDTETDDLLADITANEISGNGYARQTLAGVTWTRSGSTTTFTFNNIEYTASGGTITARRWAIYDDTSTGDMLVCGGLCDSANSDVSAPSGQKLIIRPHASGVYTATLA